MTDAEKQVVLEALGDVEKLIPEIIQAEVAKYAGAYAQVAESALGVGLPLIIQKLDAAVKAKLGVA